jgi:hypothetical protein
MHSLASHCFFRARVENGAIVGSRSEVLAAHHAFFNAHRRSQRFQEKPMPNRDDVLRNETFKGEVEDVERRVFYTLDKNKSLQGHRNSKAVALIIAHLQKSELMTEEELDELLLEVIH